MTNKGLSNRNLLFSFFCFHLAKRVLISVGRDDTKEVGYLTFNRLQIHIHISFYLVLSFGLLSNLRFQSKSLIFRLDVVESL
jgi:hypothetical protein